MSYFIFSHLMVYHQRSVNKLYCQVNKLQPVAEAAHTFACVGTGTARHASSATAPRRTAFLAACGSAIPFASRAAEMWAWAFIPPCYILAHIQYYVLSTYAYMLDFE